jgi:hypothetical protein
METAARTAAKRMLVSCMVMWIVIDIGLEVRRCLW